MDSMNSVASTGASVTRGGSTGEEMEAHGVYHITCHNKDGELLWETDSINLVTFAGKNYMLDTTFAGSAYTAAWYMSLITGGTATTASTYAVPVVTEVTSPIIAARLAVGWVAAGSGTKTATNTAFTIGGTSATITGNMIVAGGAGVTSVGNTAATGGVLFSAANFGAGSKIVSAGDVLNCTYQISI